jgi:hypothetical protein
VKYPWSYLPKSKEDEIVNTALPKKNSKHDHDDNTGRYGSMSRKNGPPMIADGN